MTEEQRYIAYRKAKAFRDSLAFYMMRILPIKKNKIVVCTFEGKGGFGCNPKYIVEELHKRNSNYEFVWLVKDESQQFPEYIKKANYSLFSRAYHLSTAKVWINNYRNPLGTKKRKGQTYIQTWHGNIGFKTIGLWRGEGFSKIAHLVSKNDSDMIDKVVVDSKWCEDIFPKGLVYNGDYIRTGMPRCDVMINDREKLHDSVRMKLGLPQESHIVMYAPTYRERGQKTHRSISAEAVTFDIHSILKAFENRFGGEWYLMLRMHPQFAGEAQQIIAAEGERIVDASKEPDMYELLAASDALITDYSSAAFDAGFANVPVFLYADDLDKYIADRGGIFWTFSADHKQPITANQEINPSKQAVLPFSIATENDELIQNISEFNEEKYAAGIEKLKQDTGLVYDGKAAERVADYIEGLY